MYRKNRTKCPENMNTTPQRARVMHRTVKPYLVPLFLCALWCLLLLLLFRRGARNEEAHAIELAGLQARTLSAQMCDTRAWNVAHGGVYVRESDYGAANPWIPESLRRVTLTDGENLVLINPAYMSRQIAERFSSQGARLRITSHAPLRPENLADAWEIAALNEIIAGASEVFHLRKDASGVREFRYIAPLRAEAACLLCHTDNQVNDVRGGVSIRLDAEPFLQAADENRASLGYAYSMTAFAGMLGIGGFFFAANRKRTLAERETRMKNAFLVNMSHDMRTPLSGIMGMTALLERKPDAGTRLRACAYLRSAVGALLEMSTDVTSHALLDAGKLRCCRKAFRLAECVEKCLELFRPECAAKNLELRLETAPSLPSVLIGDEFRLRQALGNLVSNAVKFTMRGRILARISGERHEGDAFMLRIAVQDNGPGIPPHELEKIFERFVQGEQSLRSGIPGTGLGLSISRELAQLMGGGLTVESVVGEGSEFTLSLRCTLPPPDADGGGSAPEASSGASSPLPETLPRKNLTIVLAEDDKPGAFFLREVLREAGHTVMPACDGFEALKLLSEVSADLVITDMYMPGIDGAELARRIRNGGGARAGSAVPVLGLSAAQDEETRARFRQAGVNAQLEKPVTAAQVLEIVNRLCGNAPVPGGENAAPPDAEACFHQAAALIAVNGEHGLLRKLVAVFLEDAPKQRKALAAAVEERNTAEIRRLAHGLKNSAAMLRTDALRAACAALEQGAAGHAADVSSLWRAVEGAFAGALSALRGYAAEAAVDAREHEHSRGGLEERLS
jgi:signal transduction histidine kinase/DNA-binding response OmpR family regulator